MSRRMRRAALLAHGRSQFSDDTRHVFGEGVKSSKLLLIDTLLHPSDDIELRTKLCARRFGNREEVMELSSGASLKSFGDVRRYRDRGSVHLIDERKVPLER